MIFAEKLKSMRKQSGMSQEFLAEKLGVSRQAVTKWESGAGVPEFENIRAICTLFGMSMDELFSDEQTAINTNDYLYESVTEYDIDRTKRFDLDLDAANALIVSGYGGEKLRIRLASNTLETLQSDFKLKIDDIRNSIDVELKRKNSMTQAAAKQSLIMFVQLPNKYADKVEFEINATHIELHSLDCESIELNTKANSMVLDGVTGTVEINCNLDMDIVCRTLNGEVAINQVSATSKICVPEDVAFTAVSKGVATSISYEKGGKVTESFSAENADNVIELNGIKSELVICAV